MKITIYPLRLLAFSNWKIFDMTTSGTIRVWDIPTRSFHWATVILFALAYATTDFMTFHAVAGYGLLALVIFRLIWGFIGNRYARFSEFIKSWGTVKDYTKSLITFSPPHSVGHNPLGGWVILMLLFALFMAVFTGLFSEDDGFFGPLYYATAFPDFVKNIFAHMHEGFASFLLTLVFFHVGGVMADWLMTGDKLIHAMITGNKDPKVVAEDSAPQSLSAAPPSAKSLLMACVALALAVSAVWVIIQ